MEWKERPRPNGPDSPGSIKYGTINSSSNSNSNSNSPGLNNSINSNSNSNNGESSPNLMNPVRNSGTFLNLAARRSPQPGGGNLGEQRRPISYDHQSRTHSDESRSFPFPNNSDSPPNSPSPSHSSNRDGFIPSNSNNRVQQNSPSSMRTPPLSQSSSTNSNSSQQSSNSNSNYLNTPNISSSSSMNDREFDYHNNRQELGLRRSQSDMRSKPNSNDYSSERHSQKQQTQIQNLFNEPPPIGLGIGDNDQVSDYALASRLNRSSIESRGSNRSLNNYNNNGHSPDLSSSNQFPTFVPLPMSNLKVDTNGMNNGNSNRDDRFVNSPNGLSPAFEERAPNRMRLSREFRDDQGLQRSNSRERGNGYDSNKRYSNDSSSPNYQRHNGIPSTLSIADSVVTISTNPTTDDEDNDSEAEDRSTYLISPLSGDRQMSRTSSFGLDDDDSREILNDDVGGPDSSAVVDRTGETLSWEDITEATTHIIAPRLANPSYLPSLLEMAAGTMSHKLVVLDLSFNGLCEIPAVLGNCRSLQELDIKGNTLLSGDLPSFLSTQVSLRVLIADQCDLTNLETNLASLQHLHTISLRQNRLTSLPGYISRLSSLEVLLVDDNSWGKNWTEVVRPILLHPPPLPPPPPIEIKPTRTSVLISSPSHAALSSQSSLSSTATPSPKWAKVITKKRPSIETRTTSTPPVPSIPTTVTPLSPTIVPMKEKVSRNIFGIKKSNTGTLRTQTSKLANMEDNRRRSYLPVDNYPPPFTPPIIPSRKSSTSRRTSNASSQRKQSATIDHIAGLKLVMAYLRDLDDLTPTPVEDIKTPLSPSGSQYSSRNNNLSVSEGSTRREKSGRLLKTTNSSSNTNSRASSSSTGLLNSEDNTDSPNSPKPFELKLRSDPIKREQVLKEIVASEVSYLRGLQELCDIYITPGRVSVPVRGGRQDSMIPSSERRIVFSNLEDIRDFHEQIFLPDLEEALHCTSPDDATPVAQVFLEHSAVLKIYAPYVTAFDVALARLDTWSTERRTSAASNNSSASAATPVLDASYAGIPLMSSSQRRRVKEFLKISRMDPKHTQISLQSYLLLPIQRLPRYRMLLESLLSCTPVDDLAPSHLLQPHPVVQQALELISNVTSDLNERKRESEGRQQLLYWQNRIGNKFRSPLVQPHRSMLRHSTLDLVRVVKQVSHGLDDGPAYEGETHVISLQTELEHKSIVCLLCTDIMVFVYAPLDPTDATGPVELFTVLRLAQSAGSPGPATLFSDSTLRIVCDSRAILYFQLEKREEALSWMNAINLQQALNSTS